VLSKLALLKEKQQQFSEAAFYYKRALAAAPENPVCLNRLVIVLAKNGKIEEAITILNQLAIVLAKNEKIEEAIAILEKLEKLLPDAPTVSYNLACLNARRNQPDQAIEHLEKALAKDYTDWETLQTDTDLEAIRNTPYYKKLISTLGK